MNILFLTTSVITSVKSRGIYTDLMRELSKLGNNIYIVSPSERRYKKKTNEVEEENLRILNIKTLNIQKTNMIEKGIGILLLEYQILKAIRKYWKGIKFDIIIYSTPPITFNRIVSTIKAESNASTYLLLKDIFPQNAVDLGMFKKDSFIYKLFRKKEKRLYEISDKIGCMSPANVKYLLENNPNINPNKVEIFPNCFTPISFNKPSKEKRLAILSKYGITPEKIISIYGGNLGKPQGIDFLLQAVLHNEQRKNSLMLIVGSGTEFTRIKEWFKKNKPKNSKLISHMPKPEYDCLMTVADIGLIFLDYRFTIPNFPSRFLSYLEAGIPVLIASDPVSDMGPIAEKGGFGFWCESNDIESFNKNLNTLVNNKTLRIEMGEKGRKFLEDNYVLENHLKKLFNV